MTLEIRNPRQEDSDSLISLVLSSSSSSSAVVNSSQMLKSNTSSRVGIINSGHESTLIQYSATGLCPAIQLIRTYQLQDSGTRIVAWWNMISFAPTKADISGPSTGCACNIPASSTQPKGVPPEATQEPLELNFATVVSPMWSLSWVDCPGFAISRM